MLPTNYICTQCQTAFLFPFRTAVYYLGDGQPRHVRDDQTLLILLRPIWCTRCDILSTVEDIEPTDRFETAMALVRRGLPIEYPFDSEAYEPSAVLPSMKAYLAWRYGRRNPPRALCCGGLDYQLMDVKQPLIKHAECEHGSIESLFYIGSFCGSRRSRLDLRIYTPEGDLLGLLTGWNEDEQGWRLEPMGYPEFADD